MLTLKEKVRIFKALGNETRFQILKNALQTPYVCSVDKTVKSTNIIKQATCVGTIANEFDFSLPTISRHLKEMKEARIINMEKIGNKIYVTVNLETIREVSECFAELHSEMPPEN